MAFKERKYSFRDSNNITHKRVITGEVFTHGQRIYVMKDPEMNTDHTGVADEIDEKYFPKKGTVFKRTRKGTCTIDTRLQRPH